jgi:hypothetical protein
MVIEKAGFIAAEKFYKLPSKAFVGLRLLSRLPFVGVENGRHRNMDRKQNESITAALCWHAVDIIEGRKLSI